MKKSLKMKQHYKENSHHIHFGREIVRKNYHGYFLNLSIQLFMCSVNSKAMLLESGADSYIKYGTNSGR